MNFHFFFQIAIFFHFFIGFFKSPRNDRQLAHARQLGDDFECRHERVGRRQPLLRALQPRGNEPLQPRHEPLQPGHEPLQPGDEPHERHEQHDEQYDDFHGRRYDGDESNEPCDGEVYAYGGCIFLIFFKKMGKRMFRRGFQEVYAFGE